MVGGGKVIAAIPLDVKKSIADISKNSVAVLDGLLISGSFDVTVDVCLVFCFFLQCHTLWKRCCCWPCFSEAYTRKSIASEIDSDSVAVTLEI